MQQLWNETRIKMVHLQPTASAFGRGMGTKVEEKAHNKHGRRNGGMSPPQHDAAGEDGQCTRRKGEATNQAGRCRSDWPPVGLSNMRRSHLRPPTSSSQLALLLIDSPWLGRISVSLSALVEPRQQYPSGPAIDGLQSDSSVYDHTYRHADEHQPQPLIA